MFANCRLSLVDALCVRLISAAGSPGVVSPFFALAFYTYINKCNLANKKKTRRGAISLKVANGRLVFNLPLRRDARAAGFYLRFHFYLISPDGRNVQLMQKRKPRVVEWNSCIDVPLGRGVLGTYINVGFFLFFSFFFFLLCPAISRGSFLRRISRLFSRTRFMLPD